MAGNVERHVDQTGLFTARFARERGVRRESIQIYFECWRKIRGGLDTLVLAGGIGERAPEIRAGICDGLVFLGLNLHSSRNTRGADVISAEQSRVTIRVIATDEEIVLTRIVRSILRTSDSPQKH
jgi:acetate kinase